jgi:Fe-S-cluster containining protein
MSPIDQPNPCRYIIEVKSGGESFIFCSIYNKRPKQCKNHTFDSSKCPIGINVLKISSAEDANKRINKGYAIIKKELNPLDKNDIWW